MDRVAKKSCPSATRTIRNLNLVRTLTFNDGLLNKGLQGLFYIVKTKKDPYVWPTDALKRMPHRIQVHSHTQREIAIPNYIRKQSKWLLFKTMSTLDRYPLPSLIAFQAIRWFLINRFTKGLRSLKKIFYYDWFWFETSAVIWFMRINLFRDCILYKI